MKCTDLFIQDHKIILRALDVLQQMSTRIENDQSVEAEDVQRILHFLREFADNYHQAKEESALFPELMRTSAANRGSLRQMGFEHDQERSLVEGLEDALYTKKGMEFVHFANRLTLLIRSHIHKEDNILFPIAEQSLSSEQDEHVTAELSKFEIDCELLGDLQRLEWKYLKRVA